MPNAKKLLYFNNVLAPKAHNGCFDYPLLRFCSICNKPWPKLRNFSVPTGNWWFQLSKSLAVLHLIEVICGLMASLTCGLTLMKRLSMMGGWASMPGPYSSSSPCLHLDMEELQDTDRTADISSISPKQIKSFQINSNQIKLNQLNTNQIQSN